MKIEWTETARQDRRNIYDYLDEHNPIAAIEIDDLIEEKTDLLVDHVLMGRSGREKERWSHLFEQLKAYL